MRPLWRLARTAVRIWRGRSGFPSGRRCRRRAGSRGDLATAQLVADDARPPIHLIDRECDALYALALEPSLVLLDEWLAGLNPSELMIGIDLIRSLKELVEFAGVTGYVQQLNMRVTVLMTLDGNLVQIPNATVYKSTLRNFTTNANRREDFVVGIGYDSAEAGFDGNRQSLDAEQGFLSHAASLISRTHP